ncbi:TadE/TadG family type IV pilus assembly protein [Tropheryma whipplei]|uniref:TadE/TadG family type IV pilus assembly protein n=2 Tax=Tropheryma whipplei TaxID=2039 RepID=UPI000000C90F|nr:hypothetical protein [Tropheryma whipplei]MCO8182488.1 hypothetical protein [Tropheryma whipplei]MCO8190331.1 hypothetical protein [Tropheryma whipplei]CAD67376.1 putative membrane protein [Tropheryma whipplei TW08/27]
MLKISREVTVRSRIFSERGSITAEVAISFPIVLLVSAFLYSGIQLSGKQLRLQEASAVAARQLSRGEAVDVRRVAGDVKNIVSYHNGAYVCVQLKDSAKGLLNGIEVKASSCTLDKGH